MKVMLTGANSLLGSNLSRKLLQANYEVKGFVRKSSNLQSLNGCKIEIYKGNLDNPSDLQNALKGCSIIIHAAANTSQWPSGYKHYQQINVDATKLILEESLKAGVEKFIYVGSANAFGPGSKENPGDENSLFTPLQYRSGYMRSKYEAQQLVIDFHNKNNFPATVVNPTFMLGKYDTKPSSGQLLLMAHGKKLMPCPSGGKNFIHVEDVADGIIRAIEKGKDGDCYLLANENLTYEEFFLKMKSLCGYPKSILKLPGEITSIAGRLGSFYENTTGKQAKLNHLNSQLLTTDNYYSARKAILELDLPQIHIEEAIKDALSWFDTNGYL